MKTESIIRGERIRASEVGQIAYFAEARFEEVQPGGYLRIDGGVHVESTHPHQNAAATVVVEADVQGVGWGQVHTSDPLVLRGCPGNGIPERAYIPFRCKVRGLAAREFSVSLRIGVLASGADVVVGECSAWIETVDWQEEEDRGAVVE